MVGRISRQRRKRRLRLKNGRNLCHVNNWNIFHSNLRGFSSKETSVKTIIETLRPNLITFNETLFKNNKKLRLPGYKCYNRNRQDTGGGGIATCIDSKEAINCL